MAQIYMITGDGDTMVALQLIIMSLEQECILLNWQVAVSKKSSFI